MLVGYDQLNIDYFVGLSRRSRVLTELVSIRQNSIFLKSFEYYDARNTSIVNERKDCEVIKNHLTVALQFWCLQSNMR